MEAQPCTDVRYDELEREVAAICSGWDGGFHTRSNNETAPKKVVPISAAEILSQIKMIRQMCSKSNIDRLQALILGHVHNKNNPHATDLSQFNTDILHLLYGEYTARGGMATYEAFINVIFQVYQVAGTADIWDGLDPRLLVSVRTATQFIKDHDQDPEAHGPLFAQLFPGVPLDRDPSLAISSQYNVPMPYQIGALDKYNYIGADGLMRTATTLALPLDYTYGMGLMPCFKPRTNRCKHSTNLAHPDSWATEHLTLQPVYTDTLDPTRPMYALVESTDTEDALHILTMKDMTVEKDHVFSCSIYGQALKARVYCVRLRDASLGLTHIFYVNLDKHLVLVDDSFGDIYADLEVLNSGFFRIGMSFLAKYDSEVSVEFIPYPSPQDTFSYKGKGEVLCRFFGGQFEEGVGWSPLIHTDGEAVTRTGGRIEIPLGDWYNLDNGALALEFTRPTPLDGPDKRTVYSIRNHTDLSMRGRYRNKDTFHAEVYNVVADQIWDYPVVPNGERLQLVGFGYAPTFMQAVASGNTAKSTPLVAIQRKDATMLCIGHDHGTDFYEGYFHSSTYYPFTPTLDNLTFIAGD